MSAAPAAATRLQQAHEVEVAVATITARLHAPAGPGRLSFCPIDGCTLIHGEQCPACTAAAGYHRCGNCTAAVRILVDDALCVRCDSILYPSTSWGVAS